jgi:hypothetical protein
VGARQACRGVGHRQCRPALLCCQLHTSARNSRHLKPSTSNAQAERARRQEEGQAAQRAAAERAGLRHGELQWGIAIIRQQLSSFDGVRGTLLLSQGKGVLATREA